MAVKIKLRRMGAKQHAFYRLVVGDAPVAGAARYWRPWVPTILTGSRLRFLCRPSEHCIGCSVGPSQPTVHASFCVGQASCGNWPS